MTHTQILTVPVSLCCISLDGCSAPVHSLPAPTEPQLLHALKRIGQAIQKIKLKSCRKDKSYYADVGKGAIT